MSLLNWFVKRDCYLFIDYYIMSDGFGLTHPTPPHPDLKSMNKSNCLQMICSLYHCRINAFWMVHQVFTNMLLTGKKVCTYQVLQWLLSLDIIWLPDKYVVCRCAILHSRQKHFYLFFCMFLSNERSQHPTMWTESDDAEVWTTARIKECVMGLPVFNSFPVILCT